MDDMIKALRCEQATELEMLKAWQFEETKDSLSVISAMMATTDPSLFAEIFNSDQLFTKAFGNDPGNWSSNISKAVATENLYNSSKVIVSHGLRFLGSTASYTSLTIYSLRLQHLLDTLAKSDGTFVNRKAIGLPTKRDTLEILTCIEDFTKLLDDYRKDPNLINIDAVAEQYKKFGIKLSLVGAGIEDWKVYVKKAVAALICASLFGYFTHAISTFGHVFSWFKHLVKLSAKFGGVIGIIYGDKWLAGKDKRTLKFIGWRSNDEIAQAIERLLVSIGSLQDISNDTRRVTTAIITLSAILPNKEDATQTSKIVQRTDIMCRRLCRRMTYAFASIEKASDYAPNKK